MRVSTFNLGKMILPINHRRTRENVESTSESLVFIVQKRVLRPVSFTSLENFYIQQQCTRGIGNDVLQIGVHVADCFFFFSAEKSRL